MLVDLALPHDIDPAIAELPGVTRIDLSAGGAPGPPPRSTMSRAARAIVAEEVAAHLADIAGQQVEPMLVSLRTHVGRS